MGIISLALSVIAVAVCLMVTKWALSLRTVVPANDVHIVNNSKGTTSYGAGAGKAGNVYYRWPSWIPFIGLTVTVLPVNNFGLELESYEAFDVNKVPFLVDIVGFFRIEDTNLAAARVASVSEMSVQLNFIVQGAVRTILAGSTIEEIMVGRASFGDQFTKEVTEQVGAWGVIPVKSLELMDLRDTNNSKVIANIMAKKQSFIDMESRKEVAENKRSAEIAETDAKREIDLNQQAADQAVGERKAHADKAVGIAQQQALQEVKAQQKITMEKDMAVLKVQEVETANIDKEVAVVKAAQDKEVQVVKAEADLEQSKRNAEGALAEGTAKAEAEKLLLLAPVDAQITLAKEIGSNQGYQSYLLGKEQIAANKDVGIANADALKNAELKIIANTGDAQSGIKSFGEVLSPKGGQSVAGMLEGLMQTEAGLQLVEKFVGPTTKA